MLRAKVLVVIVALSWSTVASAHAIIDPVAEPFVVAGNGGLAWFLAIFGF